eukprot:150448-Chlamydomonas_euryale.AAC.3
MVNSLWRLDGGRHVALLLPLLLLRHASLRGELAPAATSALSRKLVGTLSFGKAGCGACRRTGQAETNGFAALGPARAGRVRPRDGGQRADAPDRVPRMLRDSPGSVPRRPDMATAALRFPPRLAPPRAA